MADPDGEVLKAVLSVVKKRRGFDQVTKSEVLNVLVQLIAAPAPQPSAAHARPFVADMATVLGANKARKGEPVSITAEWEWSSQHPPRTVHLPSGEAVGVRNWLDVFHQVVGWLGRTGTAPVPVPWEMPDSPEEISINYTPTKPNGKPMVHPRSVALGGRDAYYEHRVRAGGRSRHQAPVRRSRR